MVCFDSRFRFQPYNKRHGEIWQSIEAMDHEGMQYIQQQDVDQFREYLHKTRNTICGRHPINVRVSRRAVLATAFNIDWCGLACWCSSLGPIQVLLELVALSDSVRFSIEFVRYAQSSHCKVMSDSSVSYAAGVLTVLKPCTGLRATQSLPVAGHHHRHQHHATMGPSSTRVGSGAGGAGAGAGAGAGVGGAGVGGAGGGDGANAQSLTSGRRYPSNLKLKPIHASRTLT